jgi:hypothetical protein
VIITVRSWTPTAIVLDCDQQRAAVVAVVDDLEHIAALLGIERFQVPIINDQQPDAFERGQQCGFLPLNRLWPIHVLLRPIIVNGRI